MHAVTVALGCNNECAFCALGTLRDGALPSRADVIAAIDAAPEGALGLVGGEPTLRADLPDLVAHAARGGRRVVVQTNARRLGGAGAARTLRSAGAASLDVSLHGDAAACHEFHTRAPGSFAETIAGVRASVDAGLPVATTTVVTRSNFRQLPAVLKLAAALGASAASVRAVRPLGHALRSEVPLAPAPELIAPYVKQALAEAARSGLDVAVGEIIPDALQPWFVGLPVFERSAARS